MTQVPNQLARRTFPELSPVLNQYLQQISDTVNSLTGYNGTITLNNHLDLSGNRIQNVGEAVSGSDVITQTVANNAYSASALRPQLEGNGSNPLQTVRRLNNNHQQEMASSYMNSILSIVPNANTVQVSFTNSSGSTQITVNATTLTLADGSSRAIAGRTDTVTNPSSYTISTITRSSGTVTAVLTTTPSFTSGETIGVAGVTDSSFDGSFILTGVSGVNLTWTQLASDSSSTGGTVSSGSVYYYYVKKGATTMSMVGAFTADTPQNRINASSDGQQIMAVAVVTSSGGQSSQSGGGGTPTTGAVNSGTFF